ncbi:MAG: 3D domain-containing protein [Gaiellales bacterium]
MRARTRSVLRRAVAACVIAGAALLALAGGAAAQTATTATTTSAVAPAIPPRPQSLGQFWITYYWFAPESWFTAKKLVAPGLKTAYREDFLYSARGVAMQGTGTGDDNVTLHWRGGAGAWVNKEGQPTKTAASGFTNGAPYARPGGCVWWALDPATGKPNLATTDNLRPTFANDDGTWQNPPADPAAYTVVCNKANVLAGKPDDLTYRGYLDTFGVGVGTSVTPWHSIATDLAVIPRGSTIYIDALKNTPSKGCFSADDTGGAIIGNHIDVLIPPDKTLKLPTKGELTLVPKGVDCPPPTALAPGPLGNLNVSYLVPAGEKTAAAAKTPAPGLRYQNLREDFLYGTDGVVARSIGITRTGKTIVARGGGWWVDARGRRTTLRADGTWSKGAPVWRDGGWRTRRGRPTFKRPDGTWSAGVGVRYLRYHDRFGYARKGQYIPWKTVVSTKATAPIGTLLQLDGIPSASCLVVNQLQPLLPATTIQVVVPPGTDPATLPTLSPATVLAAVAGTPTGCP